MAGEATDRPDAVPTDAVPPADVVPADVADAVAVGGRRSRLLDAVRWGLLVPILGAVGVTLWRNWEAVSAPVAAAGAEGARA